MRLKPDPVIVLNSRGYVESMEQPCPSTQVAVLAVVGPPATVRCCLLEGHAGLHEFVIRWTDPADERNEQ